MQERYILFTIIFLFLALNSKCKLNSKSNSYEEVSDAKDFKKILRTKNNVLVCFIGSQKGSANMVKTFKEAADVVKGQGSMLIVDCTGLGKKMCKKLKISPEQYVIRHYKDGEFHKEYDRKETIQSIVNFMQDPTGDAPWEEDDTTSDIIHISDYQSLVKLIKKELRPVMVMFYAPWCGFCKQLKPEYSAAATSLKDDAVMAAIDVNRPENSIVRVKFNISGFPTLLYFKDGAFKFPYDGENKKDSLITFMKNPVPAKPKPQEEEWSQKETDIVHLTTETFDTFMQGETSTLVMFYAPWCGHCKKMKPEYEKAAEQLKLDQIVGTLAAVDATKEPDLGKRFGVKGYPTVKYFKNGEFLWDSPSIRESDKIVDFMKDPKEPPPPPPPEPDWADQPSEVVHLDTENFKTFLKKKRHVLVMFYAPWCGHCKMAKPEFMIAAEETKENLRFAFAALDCTKHSTICKAVGISGYPTFKYYHYYNKKPLRDYSGERKALDFVNFLTKIDEEGKPTTTTPPPRITTPSPSAANPTKKATINEGANKSPQQTQKKAGVDKKSDPSSHKDNNKTQKENLWTGIIGVDKIVFINDKNYKDVIPKQKSTIVMFYDTWCKNCKLLATEYAKAGKMSLTEGTLFAAADGLRNVEMIEEFDITELPVLKLFEKGRLLSNYVGGNKAEEILEFIKEYKNNGKDEL